LRPARSGNLERRGGGTSENMRNLRVIFAEACADFSLPLAISWVVSTVIIFAWRMQWLPQ